MKRICKMRTYKIFTAVCALTILFTGCSGSNGSNISFRLGIDGSYTGFRNLPAEYTQQQALEDKCLVRIDGDLFGGAEYWNDFVSRSAKKKNGGIRIANFWEGKAYFMDVFYHNGYYRCFSSDENTSLQDQKFTLLLELEGTLPNAARSGKVTILTDDPTLTYKEVMWVFLSSNSHYRETISPFKQIYID